MVDDVELDPAVEFEPVVEELGPSEEVEIEPVVEELDPPALVLPAVVVEVPDVPVLPSDEVPSEMKLHAALNDAKTRTTTGSRM